MKQTAKLSLFKAPADPERRSVWERYLHRGDKRLTPDSAVCELHFEQRFIVRDYVHIINGTEVRIPRGTPTLTPDAVPTILPNVAPHLSKRLPPERNVRKRSEEDAVPRKRRRLSTTDEPAVRNRSPSSVSDVLNEPTANDDALATIAALRDVKLPNRYWTFHELREVDGACFTSCSLNASTGEVKVEKAVFFTVNADGGIHSRTFVQGKSVAEAAVFTMLDAEAVLDQASLLHLCKGAGTQGDSLTANITVNLQRQLELKSGAVFSVKCLGSTKKDGTPCFSCKYLRKALITRQSRIRKRHKTSRACSSTVKKLKVCARRNKRLMVRLGNLAKDVRRLKDESAATAEEVLAAKISLLSPKQQLAVRQCFESAKRKSPCGMQYDKEWMLECILLKIRSPKLYQYMRKQNILALPSETTIRKYTPQYRTGYGFNEKMLSALKKKSG